MHADCHQSGVEIRLARLAGRQLGVVSRDQLDALGFSRTQIARRVAHGRLHRLHHNVYAVGHQRLVARAHLLSALLSLGPRAFLSHRTAAAEWGLRVVNVRNIELTLPGSGGRRRRGLSVHRTQTEPDEDEVRIRGGLRVSSVPRMLIELADRERPSELERLITVAVRRRLLRLDSRDGLAGLEAALARHARRPGIAVLKRALTGYRPPQSHRSGLELAFDQLLRRHPELPDPQRNLEIDRWEIDRCWPERNLAVELDGRPYHIAVRDMERDRIKDAALQRLGWTAIRFTDLRLEYDPAGIVADLRAFLGVDAAGAA
ncbi:MAG: type IV toxin-antitoxin system AbiEi family antitoxin domain-containing protein [Trebonia sp.]